MKTQELEYYAKLMNERSACGRYGVCYEHRRMYLHEYGCPSCALDEFQGKIAPMEKTASAK